MHYQLPRNQLRISQAPVHVDPAHSLSHLWTFKDHPPPTKVQTNIWNSCLGILLTMPGSFLPTPLLTTRTFKIAPVHKLPYSLPLPESSGPLPKHLENSPWYTRQHMKNCTQEKSKTDQNIYSYPVSRDVC